MKLLYLSLTLSLCLLAKAGISQLENAGFDPSGRAVTHLERAEAEGWIEEIDSRSEYTAVFHTTEGKMISVSSKAQLNYKNAEGKYVPYDIRCRQNGKSWESVTRPDGVRVNEKGEVAIFNDRGFLSTFGKTVSFNGKTGFNYSKTSFSNATHITFENISTGIDKWFDFKEGGVKYSYVIQSPQVISGEYLKVTEELTLPEGCILTYDPEEGKMENGLWKGSVLVIESNSKTVKGKISALICFDKNNEVTQGCYSFEKRKELKGNVYYLNSFVPKVWINETGRAYPVTIDPLVTGPTTTWSGGSIPSCFFPAYSSDSILVTVPAAVTITGLQMTASFFATGAGGTTMADGRMYFSTICGQTGVLTVTPPGTTAGTCYMPLTDYRVPLTCCFPQQCASFTFYLKYHLSRTTNGPLCDFTYLYYPVPTSYPFTAYIEGHSPETYSSEMIFIPASICANDCTVDGRVYVRYGVPPFTFIHPWCADTIIAGIPAGCGMGSVLQVLPLNIPTCPSYCDPSTSLSVPPPVVIDACGTVVSGFNASYPLGIKPVPTSTISINSISMCSGDNFSATVSSCLPGSTLTWTGNGSSGTTLVQDTLYNTGTSPSTTTYISTVSLGGCTGIGDTLVVTTNPYVVDSFSMGPGPYLVDKPITFTDLTQLNGNFLTGDFWNFGDSSYSFLASDTNVYSDTGTYLVCHYTSTFLGCNDTSCQSILILDVELQYPNIITPNGDGLNDALYFKALEYYPGNTLTIFNRWGMQVYYKDGYTNDWKGDDLSDGVYYYIITIPNNPPVKSILHINRGKAK